MHIVLNSWLRERLGFSRELPAHAETTAIEMSAKILVLGGGEPPRTSPSHSNSSFLALNITVSAHYMCTLHELHFEVNEVASPVL